MVITFLIILLTFFHFFIKKNFALFYFISAFLLSFISIFYIPDEAADLFKYFEILGDMRIFGIQYFFAFSNFPSQPLFYYYLYLMSYFDFSFLPFFSSFLFYSTTFFLMFSLRNRFKINYFLGSLVFLFFIFSLPYISLISGIRNMLAFSLFTIGLYAEFIKKMNSFLVLLFYFTLIFLHNTILILFVVRLFLIFKNNLIFFTLSIFSFFWVLLSNLIIMILSFFPGSIFLSTLNRRLISYLFDDLIYFESSVLIRLISLIFLFYLILILLNNNILKKRSIFVYFKFLLVISLFTFGSITKYDMFIRMVIFLIINSPIILYYFFKYSYKINNTLIAFRFLKSDKFIIFSLVISALLSLSYISWSEYFRIILQL
jgi:hypothetical protein